MNNKELEMKNKASEIGVLQKSENVEKKGVRALIREIRLNEKNENNKESEVRNNCVDREM